MHKKGGKERSKSQRKKDGKKIARLLHSYVHKVLSVRVRNLFGFEAIIFVNAVLKHRCLLMALELLEEST
jgi:hypothetical protein